MICNEDVRLNEPFNLCGFKSLLYAERFVIRRKKGVHLAGRCVQISVLRRAIYNKSGIRVITSNVAQPLFHTE